MKPLAESVLAFAAELKSGSAAGKSGHGIAFHPSIEREAYDVWVPDHVWKGWVEAATREQNDRAVKAAFASGVPQDEIERAAADAAAMAMENQHLSKQAKPYDLGIIACSASKTKLRKGQVIEARDLYTGDLFVRSLAAAERLCRRVVILSAFHGVVELQQKLGEYDRPLPTAKREAQAWGSRVGSRLADDVRKLFDARPLVPGKNNNPKVLNLAPYSYARWIRWQDLLAEVAHPLKGLGIGQQKKALTQLATGVIS